MTGFPSQDAAARRWCSRPIASEIPDMSALRKTRSPFGTPNVTARSPWLLTRDQGTTLRGTHAGLKLPPKAARTFTAAITGGTGASARVSGQIDNVRAAPGVVDRTCHLLPRHH